MKLITVLYFLVISTSVFSQNKRFYEQLDEVEIDPVELKQAAATRIQILNFDQQYYGGMIVQVLNDKRARRGRNLFTVDSTYNRICNTIVKNFSRSNFSKSKKKRKIIKHTEFAIRHLSGKNRLFKSYVFYFNLTHLNNYTRFYYAAGDETTDLKLFIGKRPRTMSPTHEDYEEPIPVQALTEMEFAEGIIKRLIRNDGSADFYSRNYSHIGISMRVDEYSIRRRKIPRAYIMIIIGGKQTQKVREPRPIQQNNDEDNTPYTILR